jgi:mannose-6-phosphate isomerase-like protein (cupin superfamily)
MYSTTDERVEGFVAPAAVSLAEKFEQFTERWSPKIVAQANGWEFKLVKVQGAFVWHHHEVDEVFMVVSGRLRIHLEGLPTAVVGPGEIFVVPRGVRHRPEAASECRIMLIEPAGVRNTGDVDGPLTAVDEWL